MDGVAGEHTRSPRHHCQQAITRSALGPKVSTGVWKVNTRADADPRREGPPLPSRLPHSLDGGKKATTTTWNNGKQSLVLKDAAVTLRLRRCRLGEGGGGETHTSERVSACVTMWRTGMLPVQRAHSAAPVPVIPPLSQLAAGSSVVSYTNTHSQDCQAVGPSDSFDSRQVSWRSIWSLFWRRQSTIIHFIFISRSRQRLRVKLRFVASERFGRKEHAEGHEVNPKRSINLLPTHDVFLVISRTSPCDRQCTSRVWKHANAVTVYNKFRG